MYVNTKVYRLTFYRNRLINYFYFRINFRFFPEKLYEQDIKFVKRTINQSLLRKYKSFCVELR